MVKKVIAISFDEESSAVLGSVQKSMRSSYVRSSVVRRWREWQRAVSVLADLGWSYEAIAATSPLTNGLDLVPIDATGAIVAEHVAASAVAFGIPESEDLENLWIGLIGDDRAAAALLIVARELAGGNAVLHAKIDAARSK